MSHSATRLLKQDATYWSSTPDGYGGDVVASPVAVKCRWEERTEQFVSQIDRKETVSRAIVFLDRDVKVGDWLFEGVSSSGSPTTLASAYKVRRFDRVPDLRNLLVQRKAYL